MASYVTIDGGTTNTRLYLSVGNKVVDSLRFGIGSVGGEENTGRLKSAVKEGISELLCRNRIDESEIECVLASGMITSDGGLCPLPHLSVPCGISELSSALFFCEMRELSPLRFCFIRGVRTEDDMMRGEETELVGLCDTMGSDTLYVLPGSHTKLVRTDAEGRISELSTELTGEMLRALSEGTILRQSVRLQAEFDEAFLLRGYRRAEEKGLNAALFGVRALDRLSGASATEIYSFFLGAVYAAEVKNILRSSADTVVIGGKPSLQRPLACLLRQHGTKRVIEIPEALADEATVRGAIKIYEYAKEHGNGNAV